MLKYFTITVLSALPLLAPNALWGQNQAPSVEVAHLMPVDSDIAPLKDGDIRGEVQRRIFDSFGAQAHAINVVVYNGVVHLSGSLPSRSDVDHALAVSLTAAGVKDVKSNLLVAGNHYMSGQDAAGLRAGLR